MRPPIHLTIITEKSAPTYVRKALEPATLRRPPRKNLNACTGLSNMSQRPCEAPGTGVTLTGLGDPDDRSTQMIGPAIRTLAAVALLSSCTASGPRPATTATSRESRPSAPIVVERFGRPRCPGLNNARTSLEIEGCLERSVLQSDARINALSKAIFEALPDEAARWRFTHAARAWEVFRKADCESASDVNEGGSLARGDFISCEVSINATRLQELAGLLKSLQAR